MLSRQSPIEAKLFAVRTVSSVAKSTGIFTRIHSVLPLSCEIANFPNFFPGGRGYKGSTFPQSPVMFVGHNFDTDFGYRQSIARGVEDYLKMKTWMNLRAYFLPVAGLAEEDCFFTNFYLGAIIHPEPRSGEKAKTKNTGTFRCSADYRAACLTALRMQIEIVRPRVIALLGGNVSPAFAEAFPSYAPYCGFNLAETQLKQPAGGYRMQLLPDLKAQVICLAHPANPRSTESHRAQGSLLKEALKASSQ